MESPTFGPRYPAPTEMTSRMRNDTFEPHEFIQHPFVHDDNYVIIICQKRSDMEKNILNLSNYYRYYIYIYIRATPGFCPGVAA